MALLDLGRVGAAKGMWGRYDRLRLLSSFCRDANRWRRGSCRLDGHARCGIWVEDAKWGFS